MRDIASGGHGDHTRNPCLLLLFKAGERPRASDVRDALASSGTGHVTFDPAGSEAIIQARDWLEIGLDGLTFDVLALDPGRSLVSPPPRHCFGITPEILAGCEAIGLAPGPHLAGAANAMPVVRTLLRLGSALASQMQSALAMLWLPADSAMRRDVYVSAVDNWLDGGAFPALGLTGVLRRPDGALASDGLAFFTGREVMLEAAASADPIAATRLIVRLVDYLVEQPPLAEPMTVRLDDGQTLKLVPTGSMIMASAL